MFSIVFYHANACTSMRLLVEIDNGPDSAVWASLYKYREGYMDIPDGIDRQAKTLTRGRGISVYASDIINEVTKGVGPPLITLWKETLT